MTTSLAHIAWRPILGAALVLTLGVSLASVQAPNAEATVPSDRARVPILMYHVIGDAPAGAPYPELYVRSADLARQLGWLARNGYHPVTLRQVWDQWYRGTPLPSKPVVISFDDGHRSTAAVAFPLLAERRWAGVLNLKVRSLDHGGVRPRQVRNLIAAGWEVDAHSITHPDLTAIDDRQLRYEVAGSRTALRRQFGIPVDFFCYPAGRYDGRVVAAVKRAGFLGATTTRDGLASADEPFTLRRVRVDRSDGVGGLAARLERLSTS